MNDRLQLLLTVVVLAGIATILALNFFPMLSMKSNDKYIARSDIRGAAIEHNQKMYTLNFEQQNGLADALNSAVSISNNAAAKQITQSELGFTKIVLYRFGKPDSTIMPHGYAESSLIFSSPEWNKGEYLKDMSGGRLKKILDNSYDQ
jgi:hypothetical protein